MQTFFADGVVFIDITIYAEKTFEKIQEIKAAISYYNNNFINNNC